MPFSIAIDGPAGAGKTTTSKELAKRLGYTYVDTGAMYRTIGLHFVREGVDPASLTGDQVAAILLALDIHFSEDGRFFLNGEDVTGHIRTEEVSSAASKVSAFPECRQFLLETQRRFASEKNCIMEGRDIGTVVLPSAQLKIFLTADVKARAMRRVADEKAKGKVVSLQETEASLRERDERDSSRKAAPLRPAEDSYWLDNTKLTLPQTADIIEGLAAVVTQREQLYRRSESFSSAGRDEKA